MSRITATRYHDFCAGHRVVGQGGKCEHLHGHNYRVHFTVAAKANATTGALDDVGRVIDFGVIKSQLCEWLELEWDHKFLAWDQDPLLKTVCCADPHSEGYLAQDSEATMDLLSGIVYLPFNPTAENMAEYLVMEVGPLVLRDSRAQLIKVVIEETAKCSAAFELGD
jgi:6-pyruvoyltetrahydropterin/6-carboxytetrahydropterin synthase